MSPSRIAVLVSGRGSNLQAILDAIEAGTLDASIAGIFSDRQQAPALQRVAEPLRWSRNPKDFTDRASFDLALADAVQHTQPDWIVCAGYMRILGDAFIARFRGRLLNIHPSLLPRHRGLHTHARALEAGDARHGASVHFVAPELDAGPVIAQASIPVLQGDTPETLATRLLPHEHALLAATLQLACTGRLSEQGATVHLDGQPLFSPLQLDSSGNLTLSSPPVL